jgi:alkylation response protein AidB-like acyl-CoA dehydrogenase
VLRSSSDACPPDRQLREARFDEGLAFVHFRIGDGGLDADPALQGPVDAVFAAAGCKQWRNANIIGLGMAAPTIHEHGTPEQRALLRPLRFSRAPSRTGGDTVT